MNIKTVIPQDQTSLLFLKEFCFKVSNSISSFAQNGILASSPQYLIKLINVIYLENLKARKGSVYIKMQNLFDYFYYYFINMYGLKTYSEKKLTEALLSVIKNQNIPKINLFAKFLHLNQTHYSFDDLNFYYEMIFLFKETFAEYEIHNEKTKLNISQNVNFENTIKVIKVFLKEKFRLKNCEELFDKVISSSI